MTNSNPTWEVPASRSDGVSDLHVMLADATLHSMYESGYWLLVTPFGVYWGQEGQQWRRLGKRALHRCLNLFIQLEFTILFTYQNALNGKTIKEVRRHILRRGALWSDTIPNLQKPSRPSPNAPYRTKTRGVAP